LLGKSKKTLKLAKNAEPQNDEFIEADE
jgi:hypothetical protein